LLAQPASVEGKLGLAKAQIGKSSFAEAVRGLEELAKNQRDNPEVYDLLAQAYRGEKKILEAQRAEARAKLLRKK